jgi:hypothetical protein
MLFDQLSPFEMDRGDGLHLFYKVGIVNAALDRSLPKEIGAMVGKTTILTGTVTFTHAVSTRNLDWRDSLGQILPGTSAKVSMTVADPMSDVSVKINDSLLCTLNTLRTMAEASASLAKALGTILGM